jgi:hypothetical protein
MAARATSFTTRLRSTADAIDAAVAPVFAVLHELSDALLAAHSASNAFSVDSLGKVRAIAQRTVAGNTGWIAGTGYVSAVGALSDMPRWLEWWLASPNGPQPLRVDLDPRLPDFYDYTDAEWFVLPRGSGTTSVVGPYMDVLGANEYTVTVSAPVISQGAFIGVAAADLYLSGLERRLQPTLQDLPEPAVLANAAGRVITTTDWRLLPGQLLTADDSRTARTCRRMPWQVSVAAQSDTTA